jgi:hypothetical protein
MKKFRLLGLFLLLNLALQAQNSALNLDGYGAQVNLGNNIDARAIYTMECWIKFNSLSGDQEIISKSFPHQGIELVLHNNALNVYCMYDPENYSYINYPISNNMPDPMMEGATPNLQENVWYHLAFTWNGSKESMQLYVNGKIAGNRTDVGDINITGIANTGDLLIGNWNNMDRPLNASVDEVRLWTTYRSANEIKTGMYNEVPVHTAGLQAYYKFNEGAGSTTANSSTSNETIPNSDGLLINGPWWLDESPVRSNPNALHFDGGDDFVTVPHHPDYDFTTGTVEAWVRTENLIGNACIVGNRGNGWTRYSFHISANDIGIWNGNVYRTILHNIQPGQWAHLAFVCTPEDIVVYVNGVAIGNTGSGVGTAEGWSLQIGAAEHNIYNPTMPGEPFSGSIDEVRIWNYARSTEEIQATMNSKLAGNETNLIGLFNFDQGIADGNNSGLIIAIDGTANNNHGLLKNFQLNGTTSNWVVASNTTPDPEPPAPLAPEVGSFSPTTGPVGTTVTITGNYFSTTQTNNVVYFGTVQATVTAATATSLTVTVPSGASQLISVLNAENGLTGYATSLFSLTFGGGTSTLFDPKADITAGTNPKHVAIEDLDGDGKADMAVVNAGASSVSIYRNITVSGILDANSFDAKVDIVTMPNPNQVLIADVDGDGKKDLVIVSFTNPGGVSVLRNISTTGSITSASFAPRVDFATTANPSGLTLADVDGDGKLDIIASIYSPSGSISVLQNMATAGVINATSFAPKVDFSTGPNPFNVSAGDIDGDGKTDIVTTNIGNSTISVLRNTAAPGSTVDASSFGSKVDLTTSSGPYYAQVGDLNGDGKPEIVVANAGTNTISVFRNTASAGALSSSSFASKVDYPTGGGPRFVALNDVTGDGKTDIVATGYSYNALTILSNNTTTSAITASSFTLKEELATGTNPTSVAIGDLDGDGKPDMVVTNGTSGTLSLLKNLSAPTTLPVTWLSFSAAKKGTGVLLNWSTLMEINSDRFEIEKSVDNRNFHKIGNVKAAGASSTRKDYQYEEEQVSSKTHYYRLKQVDKDGKVHYSKVVTVQGTIANEPLVTIAPQPVQQVINIRFRENHAAGTFLIYAANGIVIKTYAVKAGVAQLEIDRAALPTGVYFYKFIITSSEVKASGKFIIE